MDLWALNLKGGGGVGVVAARRLAAWSVRMVGVTVERQRACWSGGYGGDDGGLFCGGALQMDGGLVWSSKVRESYGHHAREVRVCGKKKDGENSPSPGIGGGDPSIPEGDDLEGGDSVSGETRPDDTSVQKSHNLNFDGRLNFDWRTFRANLVAQEKGLTGDSDLSSEDMVSQKPSGKLSLKWAHPIPVPETGCVLIATDKLDGVRTFERTVILLLRIGTRDPREGPFGIILNRSLNKRIKHMKPINPDLVTTFTDCSVHFGGPLDANMFLLRTGKNSPVPSFEPVVPGICFGTRNSLDEAAALVKNGVFRPQDFQFFIGYAGWQVDQLREEIESNYWIVAACSSDLIGSALSESSAGLWEEILVLMGGHYSDLSRRAEDDP